MSRDRLSLLEDFQTFSVCNLESRSSFGGVAWHFSHVRVSVSVTPSVVGEFCAHAADSCAQPLIPLLSVYILTKSGSAPLGERE